MNLSLTPFRAFLTRHGYIMKSAFGGALAIALLLFALPNSYTSEVVMIPAPTKSGGILSNLSALAATVGVGNGPGGDDGMSNFEDILKSRWLCEQILNKNYSYHEKSWYFASEQPLNKSFLKYIDEKNIDKGFKNLKKYFYTKKDMKSGALTIVVETNSPDLSRQVAMDATALLQQFLTSQGQTKGRQRALFLKQRIEETTASFKVAERGFQDFLQSNLNYQNSTNAEVILKGKRLQDEMERQRALIATLYSQQEQALLDQKDDVPVLNILDEGNLPIEKSGPPRGLITAVSFLLFGLFAWVARNRLRISDRLIEKDA